MHVPNPLGSYPLVLRSKDSVNPRNNELMYDYVSNDLYFVNNGKKDKLAKDIYDKIVKSKIENANIIVCKSDDEGTESTAPDIKNREMNYWYINIQSRSNAVE